MTPDMGRGGATDAAPPTTSAPASGADTPQRTECVALPGRLEATLVLAAPAPRRARRLHLRRAELEQQRAARARRRDALTRAVARRRGAAS